MKSVEELTPEVERAIAYHKEQLRRLEEVLGVLKGSKTQSSDSIAAPTSTPKAKENGHSKSGVTRDWLRSVLRERGGMTKPQIKAFAQAQGLNVPKNFPHKMIYEMRNELHNENGVYSLEQ